MKNLYLLLHIRPKLFCPFLSVSELFWCHLFGEFVAKFQSTNGQNCFPRNGTISAHISDSHSQTIPFISFYEVLRDAFAFFIALSKRTQTCNIALFCSFFEPLNCLLLIFFDRHTKGVKRTN